MPEAEIDTAQLLSELHDEVAKRGVRLADNDPLMLLALVNNVVALQYSRQLDSQFRRTLQEHRATLEMAHTSWSAATTKTATACLTRAQHAAADLIQEAATQARKQLAEEANAQHKSAQLLTFVNLALLLVVIALLLWGVLVPSAHRPYECGPSASASAR